jgi:hypothetical protein
MMNELVLLFQIVVIACAAVIALRLGREALVAFTVIQMILANLFVIKQTMLFGFHATTADAFAVGSLLGFNLIQEFFDRELAKKTIITMFMLLGFYAIMARTHLIYVPSSADASHRYFVSILSIVPWLVVASMVVHMIAQVIDFVIYGALQKIFKRWLVVRNYTALICSQLADTILFTLFLWGLGIITHFWHIVIISFIIKFVITLISTPLIVLLAQRYGKKT